MGGKSYRLSLKSLFKPFPSPWPWPSCSLQPRTHSFHLPTNPAHVDRTHDLSSSNESCFTFMTSSLEPGSFSASSECSVEAAMQAVSSNRLFFDRGGGRSSKQVGCVPPFGGSVAVEMESEDLYQDFLASMKEMVEASSDSGDVKGMAWFEEMLGWYLRMNENWTHQFIVKAYVDLVLDVMGSSNSHCSTCNCASPSSPSSSTASNCASSSAYFSCLTETKEGVEEECSS